MNTSRIFKIGTTALALSLFAGCSNMPSNLPLVGKDEGSSVAGSKSDGKALATETCAAPMGTINIVQQTTQPWFGILSSVYQLPSLIPVVRLLVQQSNCFVVVDRGAALADTMQEHQMAQSGLLRAGSNYGRGQVVAADYTLEPSVTFTNSNMGSAVGMVSAFIPGASMVAMNVNMKEAQASLDLVDNRSSVQVAASTGTGEGFDFAGFGTDRFGSKYGSLGAYASTAQGKVVLAAFIDAYNNMVKSVRQYRAQHIATGLGKGGQLAVQGAPIIKAPAASVNMSIKDAQQALNAKGYSVGTADGVMGPHTHAELRKFQADQGLPTTGALDPNTVLALQQG